MDKFIKIDNVDFNATHFAGMSEAEFIKNQLASVQDSYGTDEQKTAFLRSAYAQINPVKEASVSTEKKSK